jgi:hypothetical protein
MSFFSKLRAAIWPPHHRVDPRLHDEPIEDLDGWDPNSTKKHLSEADLEWIESVVKHASTFPLYCFIRFEYHADEQTVSSHRVERMNQPRLELGTIGCRTPKQWKHVMFGDIYTTSSMHLSISSRFKEKPGDVSPFGLLRSGIPIPIHSARMQSQFASTSRIRNQKQEMTNAVSTAPTPAIVVKRSTQKEVFSTREDLLF